MHTIDKISKHELLRGVHKCNFTRDRVCDACVKGKQVRAFFKSINCASI